MYDLESSPPSGILSDATLASPWGRRKLKNQYFATNSIENVEIVYDNVHIMNLCFTTKALVLVHIHIHIHAPTILQLKITNVKEGQSHV